MRSYQADFNAEIREVPNASFLSIKLDLLSRYLGVPP